MIIFPPVTQQDTVRTGKFILNESVRLNTFSLPELRQYPSVDSGKHTVARIKKISVPVSTDTTSVCSRNSIADVTFTDPNNFISKIGSVKINQFPFIFVEKNRKQELQERTFLLHHLKAGKELPAHPLHADWILIVIIASAFLYSLVKSTSKGLFPDFTRFFLFRGINDPASRDKGGLFHWQSTILNLISFLIIGLFGYSVVSYYNLVPAGTKGIIIWLAAIGILSAGITLRHLTCVLTGAASGEHELFRQYLLGVYQSYRFGALFLFAVIILMSYTLILPVKDYIYTGIGILSLIYILRIVRLLFIFLNRNISIFYLILYLCALEILPVLIVVKYFTSLA